MMRSTSQPAPMASALLRQLKRVAVGLGIGLGLALPALADDTEVFEAAVSQDPNIMFMFDFSDSMNASVDGATRIDALRGAFQTLIDSDQYEFNAGLLLADDGGHGSGPDFPLRPRDDSAAATDQNIPLSYSVADVLTSIVQNSTPTGDGTPLIPSFYELGRYWANLPLDLGDQLAQPQWVNNNGVTEPFNGYYRPLNTRQRRAAHPASFVSNPDDPSQVVEASCFTSCTASNGTTCVTPRPLCANLTDAEFDSCRTSVRVTEPCLRYEGDDPDGCTVELDGECLEFAACLEYGEPYSLTIERCGYRQAIKRYDSPMNACQLNAVILMSDGAPSFRQDGDLGWRLAGLREFINDHANGGAGEVLADANDVFDYCAAVDSISSANIARVEQIKQAGRCGPELARMLYENDLRSSAGEAQRGTQRVITYTVGFDLNAQPETSDYLKLMARAGHGQFYPADNADELVQGLQDAVNDLLGRTVANASFAAPGLTAGAKISHGDYVYVPMFEPSATRRWVGNVKGYKIDRASGALLDIDDNSAVNVDTGEFKPTARSRWRGPTDPPDGNDVAVGGMAGQLQVRNEIAGPRAYTYTQNGADLSLNQALHSLEEGNSEITFEMLGIGEDEALREQLLRWARGQDVLDENANGATDDARQAMGDPLHTSPNIIRYEQGDSEILFITTNEGFLHAFDVQAGREVFAFMPRELLPNLRDLMENAPVADQQGKVYGLDGPMTVWHDDGDNNGIVNSGERVMLYLGMRRGGRSYFALDVSDVQAPRLAWRIEGGSEGFERLGQSWSEPQLVKVKTGTGTPEEASELLLAFAGGYDYDAAGARQDDPAELAGNRQPDGLGNAIFMVDPLTGELRWSAGANDRDNLQLAAMSSSIPSELRAIDVNGDGVTDRFYVGDLGGRLWRIDLIDGRPGETDAQDRTIAQHSFGYLLADLGGDSADNRRFFNPPEVGQLETGGAPTLYITIGSGHRAHPRGPGVQDQFFSIRDSAGIVPPVDENGDLRPPVTPADLLDVTNEPAPSAESLLEKRGWRLALQQSGEKSLSAPLMILGKVFFTTYAPKETASGAGGDCAGDKENRLYIVSLHNGAPVLAMDDGGNAGGAVAASGGEVTAADRFQVLSTDSIPSTPYVYFSPVPEQTDPQDAANAGVINFGVDKLHIAQQDSRLVTLLWRTLDPRKFREQTEDDGS